MAEEIVINITANDAASGQLREVVSLLDRSEKEVRDLGDASQKTSMDSKEFGKSMMKATIGAHAIMEGAKLAADAVIGVGKALVDAVKGAAEFGDATAKSAEALGVSAESLQEYAHAATLSGTSQKAVENGFKRLSRVASDAANGQGRAAQTLAKLGISAKGADGNLRALPELTEDIATKFQGMTNDTEKVALAQELFGRAGTELIPMLEEGGEGIAAMRQEAQDLGMVMSEEATQDAEAFQDELARLSGMATGLKNNIGAALLPALSSAMKVFRELVGPVDVNTEAIQDFAFNAIDSALRSIGNLARGLADFSPILSILLTGIQNNVIGFQMMINVVQTVGQTILGVFAKAIAGALSAVEKLIGAAAKAGEVLGLDLAEDLRSAEAAVGSLATEASRFGEASFDEAKQNAKETTENVKEMVGNIKEIPGTADKLAKGLLDLGKKTGEARKMMTDNRVAQRQERQAAPAPSAGGGGGGGGESKDDAEARAKAAEKEAEAQRKANEAEARRLEKQAEMEAKLAAREMIARKELQAMRTTDEVARARLEHEARMLALAQQDMTQSEHKIAQLKSEQKMREEILATQEETLSKQEQTVQGMRDFADAAGKSGAQVAGDIGNVVGVMADLKEGEASATDALGAAGTAATSFAGELGASAEAQAGIMAIFETAMGFATLFTNPAASAGHFLAAANFGLIAGGVLGASGGGGGGGGAGGSALGATGTSPEKAQRESNEALVEALTEADRMEGGKVTNIYDFSGATMLESAPATQNRIEQANERGRRRRVAVGGRR